MIKYIIMLLVVIIKILKRTIPFQY